MASFLTMLCFLVQMALAAAPTFPVNTTLQSSDGLKLAAYTGLPAKSSSGVVLIHQLNGSREDWVGVGERLFKSGVAVVLLDLRGHGGSPLANNGALTEPDYPLMQNDVMAAVAWLRTNNVQKVALMGASIGANLALRVAADDAAIANVVLLSPGFNYKGLSSQDAMKRYGARPVLFVVSEEDAYSKKTVDALTALATGEKRTELLVGAGHGTKMFAREPSLEANTMAFITSHWSTSGTTKAAGDLDIEVGDKPVSTGK